MTSTRFHEILAALHWSQRGLADILGCSDGLIRSWATGRSPVPASIATWLEARAMAIQGLPPPTDFKRRAGRPPAQRVGTAMDPDPRTVLRAACAAAGSQAAWARSVGVSPQRVNDLLAGRLAFYPAMLARLGLPRSVPPAPFPFGWTVGGGA